MCIRDSQCLQAFGHGHQQGVTDAVAQRVVDVLEVVQVNEPVSYTHLTLPTSVV